MPAPPQFSDFDLLSNRQRVVHLDPEIADGALNLRVTQEQLHGSQIAGLAIDQRRFRSAKRMRAEQRGIKPDQ